MKPEGREGLTAGEVSKMLGIPISTVEKLFDKGIIEGWNHPVTGWRMIDPKSVEALKTLKEKITKVPQKEG